MSNCCGSGGTAVERGAHAGAFAILAGWFAICELLIWPSADVPIIDDWTYAWSVKHWLETGRLEILPISSVYPVTQIVWGAAFALPAGFSFTALRISTLVLAFIGAWALYLTLRELGCKSERALLGTFCVVCNPVSMLLAHSFMTDVPCFGLVSCAVLSYVRGFEREQPGLLWLAVLLCTAAVLIRQVAIVVPFAAAAVCLVSRKRALRSWALAPALAACASGMCVWVGANWLFGPNSQQSGRLNRLQYLTSVGLDGYLRLTVELLLTVTFMLFPLALASLAGRSLRWIGGALCLGTSCFLATCWLDAEPFAWNPFDTDRATLSVYELGGARNLIAGSPVPASHWTSLARAASALTFVSLGIGLAALATALRGTWLGLFGRPAVCFNIWLGLLHVALMSVLWLYCDRYYLALLPTIVLGVLYALRTTPISRSIGVAALTLQTAIGIVGTRDALQYNETCARAYAELTRAGVAPYDIDAGWSFNGWMLYARPENLPEGLDRERDVPAVTSERARPYVFAKSHVPGYQPILRFSWAASPWPWPNELLVLRANGLEPALAERVAP